MDLRDSWGQNQQDFSDVEFEGETNDDAQILSGGGEQR